MKRQPILQRQTIWAQDKLLFLNLSLPIFLLLFILLCLLINEPHADNRYLFFINIFGLNAIHVCFTYMAISSSHQVKGWISDKVKSTPHLKTKVSLLIIVFALFCEFAHYYPIGKLFNHEIFTKFYLSFWLVLPIHHVFMQSLGLSLNFNYLQPGNDKKTSFEKSFYQKIMYLVMLTVSINFFFPEKISQIKSIITLLLYLIIFSAYCLSLKNVSGKVRKLKAVFALRFFLFPLIPYNSYAAIGYGAVHGFEYLHFNQSSYRLISKSMSLMGVLILSTVTVLALANPKYGLPVLLNSSDTAKAPSLTIFGLAIVVIDSGLTLIHYLLDHKLFKMSTNASKKWILPVLKNLYRGHHQG
jgi:hypothetical protein